MNESLGRARTSHPSSIALWAWNFRQVQIEGRVIRQRRNWTLSRRVSIAQPIRKNIRGPDRNHGYRYLRQPPTSRTRSPACLRARRLRTYAQFCHANESHQWRSRLGATVGKAKTTPRRPEPIQKDRCASVLQLSRINKGDSPQQAKGLWGLWAVLVFQQGSTHKA